MVASSVHREKDQGFLHLALRSNSASDGFFLAGVCGNNAAFSFWGEGAFELLNGSVLLQAAFSLAFRLSFAEPISCETLRVSLDLSLALSPCLI